MRPGFSESHVWNILRRLAGAASGPSDARCSRWCALAEVERAWIGAGWPDDSELPAPAPVDPGASVGYLPGETVVVPQSRVNGTGRVFGSSIKEGHRTQRHGKAADGHL
jgi:hypothetical protein